MIFRPFRTIHKVFSCKKAIVMKVCDKHNLLNAKLLFTCSGIIPYTLHIIRLFIFLKQIGPFGSHTLHKMYIHTFKHNGNDLKIAKHKKKTCLKFTFRTKLIKMQFKFFTIPVISLKKTVPTIPFYTIDADFLTRPCTILSCIFHISKKNYIQKAV